MKRREADTYFLLGLRYSQDGDNQRAIDFFSIAIDVDPYFAEAYGFRGIARFSLNMPKEALIDFNSALVLDSSLDTIYFFRALLYLHFKRYDKAITDFTSAIELDKYFAEAYFYRGICKGMVDDLKGATYDIQAAASLGMPEAQKKLNEKAIAW
jgi:tetratricopeptide (TPR) repeat protein